MAVTPFSDKSPLSDKFVTPPSFNSSGSPGHNDAALKVNTTAIRALPQLSSGEGQGSPHKRALAAAERIFPEKPADQILSDSREPSPVPIQEPSPEEILNLHHLSKSLEEHHPYFTEPDLPETKEPSQRRHAEGTLQWGTEIKRNPRAPCKMQRRKFHFSIPIDDLNLCQALGVQPSEISQINPVVTFRWMQMVQEDAQENQRFLTQWSLLQGFIGYSRAITDASAKDLLRIQEESDNGQSVLKFDRGILNTLYEQKLKLLGIQPQDLKDYFLDVAPGVEALERSQKENPDFLNALKSEEERLLKERQSPGITSARIGTIEKRLAGIEETRTRLGESDLDYTVQRFKRMETAIQAAYQLAYLLQITGLTIDTFKEKGPRIKIINTIIKKRKDDDREIHVKIDLKKDKSEIDPKNVIDPESEELVDCYFSLNLEGKGFMWIPTKFRFASLSTLHVMKLGNNYFSHLPRLNAPFLREIDISNNRVTAIPEDFEMPHPSLHRIIAYNNKICMLPPSLACFQPLQVIDVRGNPEFIIGDFEEKQKSSGRIENITVHYNSPASELP